MGLEILEQAPDVDAIVVPVGGGGLLSGIGTVIKAEKPDVEMIGVEPEHAACLTAALAAGKPVKVPLASTLADGLAVPLLGDAPFSILRHVVDEVVTVDEASIALAILRLIELEKSVVEGAGAAPLAALISGKLDRLAGKKVVLTLCGGNIDLSILDRVLEVGLVADGRLWRFTVSISDRPGALSRLSDVIGSTGASIKEIVHDRAFAGPDMSSVRVVCVVETTGRDPHPGAGGRVGEGRDSRDVSVVAGVVGRWVRPTPLHEEQALRRTHPSPDRLAFGSLSRFLRPRPQRHVTRGLIDVRSYFYGTSCSTCSCWLLGPVAGRVRSGASVDFSSFESPGRPDRTRRQHGGAWSLGQADHRHDARRLFSSGA